jgi:hypothetical protein
MFFLNTAGHATPPYSGERFSPYKYRTFIFFGGGGRGKGVRKQNTAITAHKKSIYEDKKAREPSDRELV